MNEPGIGARPLEEERNAVRFAGYDYSYRIIHQERPTTEPIVLLGGVLQDQFAWTGVEQHLSAHTSVITVDLPGSGDSDVLPAYHGFDFLADALAHVLDDAGIPRANLFGACYGALTAGHFICRHPARTVGAVLASVGPELAPQTRDSLQYALDALVGGDPDEFVRTTVDLFFPPTAGESAQRKAITLLAYRNFHSLSPDGMDKYVQNTLRVLRHPLRPREDVPADVRFLIVAGEHDRFAPPGLSRELAVELPRADFAVIRDAGHLLSGERPEALADLIANFTMGRSVDTAEYLAAYESSDRLAV